MNLVQGFTNNVATQQGGAAPTPQIAMIHLPKGVKSASQIDYKGNVKAMTLPTAAN